MTFVFAESTMSQIINTLPSNTSVQIRNAGGKRAYVTIKRYKTNLMSETLESIHISFAQLQELLQTKERLYAAISESNYKLDLGNIVLESVSKNEVTQMQMIQVLKNNYWKRIIQLNADTYKQVLDYIFLNEQELNKNGDEPGNVFYFLHKEPNIMFFSFNSAKEYLIERNGGVFPSDLKDQIKEHKDISVQLEWLDRSKLIQHFYSHMSSNAKLNITHLTSIMGIFGMKQFNEGKDIPKKLVDESLPAYEYLIKSMCSL